MGQPLDPDEIQTLERLRREMVEPDSSSSAALEESDQQQHPIPPQNNNRSMKRSAPRGSRNFNTASKRTKTGNNNYSNNNAVVVDVSNGGCGVPVSDSVWDLKELLIPSVCIPYFGTAFGMRGMKLGELLLHYLAEVLSKTLWSRLDHEVAWREKCREVRAGARRKLRAGVANLPARLRPRRSFQLYVPATAKASPFWIKMGGSVIPQGSVCLEASVVDSMWCFNAETTQLLRMDCQELLDNSKRKVSGSTMPSLSAFREALHKTWAHFRMARAGCSYEALLRLVAAPSSELKNQAVHNGWTLLHEAVQRSDPESALGVCHLLWRKGVQAGAIEKDWKQNCVFFAANLDRAAVSFLV